MDSMARLGNSECGIRSVESKPNSLHSAFRIPNFFESPPARIRTGNVAFEARNDDPFHYRGNIADPGVEPGRRAYETQPNADPSAREFRNGECGMKIKSQSWKVGGSWKARASGVVGERGCKRKRFAVSALKRKNEISAE